jgi:cytochrome c oxidase subunit III
MGSSTAVCQPPRNVREEEHRVHRTGELYGQFETLEQQKDTAQLGMWIFLVTEVLFFGGMFLTYTINRHAYSAAFGIGGNTLDLRLGGFNTVVLIMSSLTMAMAVWAAQVGKKQWITLFLIATLILGGVFLGVKAIEYKQKYDHHLIPGSTFDVTYCVNNPSACGLGGKKLEDERKEIEEAIKAEENENPGSGLIALNAHAQLYFSLYFAMTGLHALHMVIGAGLLLWLIAQAVGGRFGPGYNTPVEVTGLYWHFVDIVWIYLFPLLYLIDRHN